eukprot:UN23222
MLAYKSVTLHDPLTNKFMDEVGCPRDWNSNFQQHEGDVANQIRCDFCTEDSECRKHTLCQWIEIREGKSETGRTAGTVYVAVRKEEHETHGHPVTHMGSCVERPLDDPLFGQFSVYSLAPGRLWLGDPAWNAVNVPEKFRRLMTGWITNPPQLKPVNYNVCVHVPTNYVGNKVSGQFTYRFGCGTKDHTTTTKIPERKHCRCGYCKIQIHCEHATYNVHMCAWVPLRVLSNNGLYWTETHGCVHRFHNDLDEIHEDKSNFELEFGEVQGFYTRKSDEQHRILVKLKNELAQLSTPQSIDFSSRYVPLDLDQYYKFLTKDGWQTN